jgi:hypothetical protein
MQLRALHLLDFLVICFGGVWEDAFRLVGGRLGF